VDYPRYDPHSAVTPLTPAELNGLDRLLQALPADAAMTLDGMDGYLTALLAAPVPLLASLSTADWLPWVWGGDGEAGNEAAAPFASKRQRKSTVVLVLRHLRHLSEQLTLAPDQWEPIFSIAENGATEWVDARDWCAGFLQAVDLQPDAWAAVWQDPVLGPALAPLTQLGGGLDSADGAAEELQDPALVDQLSREVPEAVLGLLHSRA
jgi:uncharacterized protein